MGVVGEPVPATVDASTAMLTTLSEGAQRSLEVNAPVSQEQANRHAEANEIRPFLNTDQDPLQALENAFVKSSIPSREAAEQRARAMVFREASEPVDVKQKADLRSAEITAAESVARYIVDNGTITQPDGNSANIDGNYLAQLQTSIRLLASRLTDSQLTPDQVLLFADQLARDPEILTVLVQKYAELQSREVPPDLTAALEAKAKADKVLSDANAAKAKAEGERGRLGERDKSLNEENGSDNKRLAELEASQPQLRLERDQRDYARAEKAFDALNAKYGSKPTPDQQTEIEAAEADANRLYGKLSKTQQEITEQTTLKNEKKELPARITASDRALEDATRAFEQARDEQGRLDAEYSLAKGRRINFENQYRDSAVNLLRDSALQVMRSRIVRVNNANQARVLQEANASNGKLGPEMSRSMSRRYLKRVPEKEVRGKYLKWRKTTVPEDFVTDGARVEADFKRLFDESRPGIVGLVEETLIDAFTPKDAQGKPTGPPEMAKVDRNLTDPAFMAHWGPEVGRHVIDMYIQTGGMPSEGQYRYIEAQPWGREIVRRVIKTPEVAAFEAELKQKGELPGGLEQAIATEKGKSLIGLIFQIAAGTMGAGAASALATATGKGR